MILRTGDIERRIKEIQRVAKSDPESAHAMEYDLWQEVLERIASGARCTGGSAAMLAKAALMSLKIEFPRWYA